MSMVAIDLYLPHDIKLKISALTYFDVLRLEMLLTGKDLVTFYSFSKLLI